MNRAVPLLIGLVLSSAAWPQAANHPDVKAGDSWTYTITTERGTGWNQTHEEYTVVRVTPDAIFLSVKTSGSTQPPREVFTGSDWSRIRDVNGKQTVVNRPFAFPLSLGKSWEIAYTEQNPNKVHTSESFDSHFTVVGYETVQVPAGTFRALKIEAEGQWKAQLAPIQSVVQGAEVDQGGATLVTHAQKTTAREATGKTYKAVWYVPEVKRWVKSVEEYYSSGGVRTERFTQELESYKVADSNGVK